MKRVLLQAMSGVAALALAPITLGACGSDETEAGSADGAGEVGSQPAVMLSVIGTSPDARQTYVAAFDGVPTGEVQYDQMLEFGDAYFYTFDGSIFVWEREEASITRFEVAEDFKLIRGKTVSFASYGLKYDGELTFISPSRAYMVVASQASVVVWDPSTMELGSSFAMPIPARADLDTFPIQIGVSGENVYWAFISMNYDAQKLYPKNVVAIAPKDADGPVTIVEDDRCVPSLGGYLMTNGDVYLVGGADADAITLFNRADNYPPSCVLRIKAGAATFDADYFFRLKDVTGSPSVVGTWRINDEKVLARVWDPAEPLPEASDDYWSSQSFVSKSIDLSSQTSVDFPALPKGGFSSNIADSVDDATYFSLPRADGGAEVAYRLEPDGITEAFTIPSAGYWGMRRIR